LIIAQALFALYAVDEFVVVIMGDEMRVEEADVMGLFARMDLSRRDNTDAAAGGRKRALAWFNANGVG
jgi:hypothetical protein